MTARRALPVKFTVGLLAVAALLLGGALPASAHAELEGTDPADGAVLATVPDEVTLTFGEDLIDQGNAVTATQVGAAQRLALPDPVVDGETVTVAWPADADSGEFEVAYRVVSADGHPITGAFTFTIANATPSASPSGDASASAAASASASATTSAVPVGESAAAASASPAAAEPAGPGARLLSWIIGFGLVVLIGVGAGTWFWRRARRS